MARMAVAGAVPETLLSLRLRSRLAVLGARRRLLRAALLALAVGGVLALGRPTVATARTLARNTVTGESLSAGLATASALETYRLEYGRFPAAADAPALGADLAAFLPPASLAHAVAFSYTATGLSYDLTFTPDPGGVPVRITATVGQGGQLTAGGVTVPVRW